MVTKAPGLERPLFQTGVSRHVYNINYQIYRISPNPGNPGEIRSFRGLTAQT